MAIAVRFIGVRGRWRRNRGVLYEKRERPLSAVTVESGRRSSRAGQPPGIPPGCGPGAPGPGGVVGGGGCWRRDTPCFTRTCSFSSSFTHGPPSLASEPTNGDEKSSPATFSTTHHLISSRLTLGHCGV